VAEVINNKLIALEKNNTELTKNNTVLVETGKIKDKIAEQMQAQNQQIIETHQQEKAQIQQENVQLIEVASKMQQHLISADQKVEDKEAQLKEKDETIARFDKQFEALNTKLANQSVFYNRLQEQTAELMQQSMLQSQIGVNQMNKMESMIQTIMQRIDDVSMRSSKSSKHSKYNTNNKADQEKILEGVNLVKSQEVDLNQPRKVSEVESEYCNDNRSSNYTDMIKKQEAQHLTTSDISIID
jgi:hypothetical protein